ncbi:methyltransferase domain-containing protein [bacterium]|nr:methyltransferase domain-containing protein [bacterium]
MEKNKTLLDINIIISKAQIKPGQKIAELGCGSLGYFIFPMAKIVGNEGKVFAVDVMKQSSESVEKIKRERNVNNIITIWSDLEIFKATKIETESIDQAFLINTLYQSNKKTSILREAYRILKKGGGLTIVEWDQNSSTIGPPIKNRVKKDLLKIGVQKIGFRVELEFNAGNYHYGLLLKK